MTAILFDLDGTMIDDTENIVKCFRATLREFGFSDWSSDEIKELIGLPLENIFFRLGPYGREMKAFHEKMYASMSVNRRILIDGIDEVMEALDSMGVRKGIVTSRGQRMAEKIVKALDMRFDCIVGGDGIKPKPSEEPILKAMELLGEESTQSVLYIGDTRIDAKSAENAHVDFVGVSWGIDGEDLNSRKFARSPYELLTCIKEFIGATRLIRQGAEAKLYEDTFLERRCVVKKRVEKGYRVRELDNALRFHRTREEAKLMRDAREAGVMVPRIYDVTSDSIVMELVEGERVKEILENRKDKELCRSIGSAIGTLHSHDIIHGDLTTSNMLVRDGELFFIDFGLGERSFEIEKKGVDLHVLLEAFTAVGEEDLFEDVLAGYESAYDRSSEVIKRVKEITMRGRYAT